MPSLNKRIKISARPKPTTGTTLPYIFQNTSLYPVFGTRGNAESTNLMFTGGRIFDPIRGKVGFMNAWWDAGQGVGSDRSSTYRNEVTPFETNDYNELTKNASGVDVTVPRRRFEYYTLTDILNTSNYGNGAEVTTGEITLTGDSTPSQFYYQRSLGLSVLFSQLDAVGNELETSSLTKMAVGDRVRFAVFNPVSKEPLILECTVTKGLSTYGTRQFTEGRRRQGDGIDNDVGYFAFDANTFRVVANPDNIDQLANCNIHLSKIVGASAPQFAEFDSWANLSTVNYNTFDIGGQGVSAAESYKYTYTFIFRNHKKIMEFDHNLYDLIIRYKGDTYRATSLGNLDGKFVTVACAVE